MKTRNPALTLAAAGLVLLAACGKQPPKAPAPSPVPKAEVFIEGVPPEDAIILRDLLHVDGVMVKDTQHVAAINHQVVRAGEFLRLKVRSRKYTLQLLSITQQRILVKAVEEGYKPAPPRVKAPAQPTTASPTPAPPASAP
ncbi:MAG: hypothetical protein V1873_06965 [Verrucomicrobiota bacterium]